jgi:hypothetical protein
VLGRVDDVRGTALLDDQAVFHKQNAVGRLARELDLVRRVCASPPRTLKAATSDVIVSGDRRLSSGDSTVLVETPLAVSTEIPS